MTGSDLGRSIAQQLIECLCQEDGGYQRDRGWSNETVRVPISNLYVGRIIGKGGSKIRELQDRSGCRIKVYKDEQSEEETPIEFSGTSESIGIARELVEDLMSLNFRQ